ncbi:MAG: hypothetical protein AAFR61_13865 [Bacteroidota bacterium]
MKISYLLRTSWLWLGIFVLSQGCRTGFDLATLQPVPPSQEKLPRLMLEFDDESFDALYPITLAQYEEYDEDQGVLYATRPQAHPRFMDLKTITERSMERSMTLASGPYYGRALLKTTHHSVERGGEIFMLLSGFSMFTLNLLGMPVSNLVSVVELEMELYDARGNRLKSYIGQGTDRLWQGFYVGSTSGNRSVHASAVKMALLQIQEQMTDDAPMLREVFAKIGPMKSESAAQQE